MINSKTAFGTAQIAAQAIAAYLSNPLRKGGLLEGATLNALEAIEGDEMRWLAHLTYPKASGSHSAHIFVIDPTGCARRDSGYCFSADELLPPASSTTTSTEQSEVLA